jgi:hypothetical protein
MSQLIMLTIDSKITTIFYLYNESDKIFDEAMRTTNYSTFVNKITITLNCPTVMMQI